MTSPSKSSARSLLRLILLLLLSAASSYAHAPDRGLGVSASPGSRRVALVIGNGAYQTSPPANPVNDARDVATALTGLGFEVRSASDLSQREMGQVIREFGQQIKGEAPPVAIGYGGRSVAG